MVELGARPHPPRPVYRAHPSQRQDFVGIYWQSYGWVAPGEPMSGLEDEYRLSAGMPRLIYVKSPAPGREARLAEMLNRVRDSGDVSYQRFSDPQELQSLVQNDLPVLLSERFEMVPAGADQAQEALEPTLPATATPLVGREEWARAGWRWRSLAGSVRASPMGCVSSTWPRFSGPTWWWRPSPPG